MAVLVKIREGSDIGVARTGRVGIIAGTAGKKVEETAGTGFAGFTAGLDTCRCRWNGVLGTITSLAEITAGSWHAGYGVLVSERLDTWRTRWVW